MDRLQTFDLVLLLGLLAWFILGYAQGVIRRLMGLAAVLFSLVLGSLLRPTVGQYLANEWTGIVPQYSYMVGFGAVFVASVVTLSIGIQISYHPAPLFPKYPVLDELLGGVLGVVEGLLFIVAFLVITDPYFNLQTAKDHVGFGEFGIVRTIHDLLEPTLIADILRHTVIPVLLTVLGFLFQQDVRDAFARALTFLTARR